MKNYLVYFLIILAMANAMHLMNEVKSFLVDNGLKHVTLRENSTLPSAHMKKLMLILSQNATFYLRQSQIEHYTNLPTLFDADVQIFIFNPEQDGIGDFLHVIQQTKVKRSILLATAKLVETAEENLRMWLGRTPNLFFYLAISSEIRFGGAELSWSHVISLRSGYIIDKLKFLNGSYTILEDYNLKGLKLTSISLPWMPFFTLEECDVNGTNCGIQNGYIKDYMEALSKDLNFTYNAYLEQGCGLSFLPRQLS